MVVGFGYVREIFQTKRVDDKSCQWFDDKRNKLQRCSSVYCIRSYVHLYLKRNYQFIGYDMVNEGNQIAIIYKQRGPCY